MKKTFPGKEVLAMNLAPHVAAVHDLSGMGRCSLGVVLPVLSAMGCRCSSLPTAYLSANTIFPPSDHFVFRDLTDEMIGSLDHWEEIGCTFDSLYSGFVGSERQIAVVEDFFRRFKGENTLILVDPVMGDWGKPYRTYTSEMCRRMGALAELADVITPNMTEAAILLNEVYETAPKTPEALEGWLRRLSLGGKRSVILTGVHPQPGLVGAGCYDRETDAVSFTAARKVPIEFPGTGDLFASVALGELLRGTSLEHAAHRAVEFVSHCAQETKALGAPVRHGVQFETLLEELARRA